MINTGIMINNFKIGLHPYYIATPLNSSRVFCYVYRRCTVYGEMILQ